MKGRGLHGLAAEPRNGLGTVFGAVVDASSAVRLAGRAVRGYAVLGKAVVDLRREDLPDGVRVSVRAVLGEVEVQLPPGSRVEMTGVSVLGERKLRVAAGRGPVVHLDAVAVLGGVSVTVGDGSVVPAASRDWTGLAAGEPHRPVAPALPQRQSPRQRLVQRFRNVFGGTRCDDACDGQGTSSVVRVRGIGGFGSLEVVTQSEQDGRPEAGSRP